MTIDRNGALPASDRQLDREEEPRSADPSSPRHAPPNSQHFWQAIELLARRRGWSLSGLATRAGLDATALNKSKRTGNGRPRWPSTETLTKLLAATQTSFVDFARMLESVNVPDGEGATPAMNGRGHVLVVDDDAIFREALATSLRQAGYSVHLAADHRDALELLDAGQAVDVLCADIVMPAGLGGLALGRLARQRRPDLKLLYVTGYDIPRLEISARAPILRKPVELSRLVKEIDRLVEAKPDPNDQVRQR